jgi:hypothetical protein
MFFSEACMHGKTNLTIQDYFRRSGVCSTDAVRVRNQRSSADQWDTALSKALAASRTGSGTNPRGLSIRDYMSRPLMAKGPLNALAPMPGTGASRKSDATAAAPDDAKTPPPPPAGTSPGQPANEKNRIMASIDRAARKYQLPGRLLEAVVRAESDFQVRAVSPAGARGLMQLMPATARELGVADPFDIDQNIDGGARYLRRMLDQFGGDLNLALSAYNAGPGNVIKYKGHVPFAETRTYVDRVMRLAGRCA